MVIRIPTNRDVLEIETEDLIVDAEYGESSGDGGSGKVSPFAKKNAKFNALILLAVLVGVFLFQMDSQVSEDVLEDSEEVEHKDNTHGSSFGGINNIASPGGAKAAAVLKGVAYEDIIVPVSNVGHAIPSLNEANIKNLVGHYMHDEHRSPYSSHLYDKSKEFLDEQQGRYLAKMKRVREKWGAWDFKDPSNKKRKAANFKKAPYKDLDATQFPKSSWQVDEEYNKAFLKEAKALVRRMKNAIHAEYGWPMEPDMNQEELDHHAEIWKIEVDDVLDDVKKTSRTGIATLTSAAMDGLVRKLLHSMMTHDDFYVVLAGHSAAAGHGNDFMQNRIMTFHKIMEPVFDKLGMRLISRNMAMGGVGTLQFSLAGGDLYGEADIIEWDSGMTEKGPSVDLFNKQAILSGERVPLIMTDYLFDIIDETGGLAYMGQYTADNNPIFPKTTLENVKTIPYAAQWYDQSQEKYNAICWEPRSDYTPETMQKEHPGSQVGWHPGNRHHTWQGRRLAIIVLEALTLALDKWENSTSADGRYPLSESHWHVGSEYEAIRDKLRKHIMTPNLNDANEDVRSECDKLYPWIPRICRVQMHGYGMWSPRVLSDFDFINLIHPAPNGYKPKYPKINLYNGFDLMPLSQALSDDEIDVHAIAIATTDPVPKDVDHDWTDSSSDQSENNGLPPTRRYLQKAAEAAMDWSSGQGLIDAARQQAKGKDELRRNLAEDTVIVPGRGWEVHGWDPVNQFCDGSAQSECARTKSNDCLLYGTNDKHMDVAGSSRSGWLVFTVPKVQEGIILIRMEWWCFMGNERHMTTDWTEVNNGKTNDKTPWNETNGRRLLYTGEPVMLPDARRLKPTFEQVVPKDLEMDYAINGTISTIQYEKWKLYSQEKAKNVAIWPLLNDVKMAEKEWDGAPIEVAIRFRSEEKPNLPFCISHVYYA